VNTGRQPRPQVASGYPGVQTFRGATLEEVLPRVRVELGPNAVVLAQRDGIVGGIAGFFGRRCVEVDAAAAPFADALPFSNLPVPLAAAAYGGLDVYDTGFDGTGLAGTGFDDTGFDGTGFGDTDFAADPGLVADAVSAPRGHDDDLWDEPVKVDRPVVASEPEFAGILASFEEERSALSEPDLARSHPPTSTRVPQLAAGAPEIEPAIWEELTVRHTLAAYGFRPRSIEEIISLAHEHIRPLAPELTIDGAVRAAMVGSLRTPRGWTSKRKTIVLAGVEGSGTGEVAAGLAASYAAAGKRVALLGLAGPRAAVSLAMGTDDVDVSFGICDEPDDVQRVLARLGEVQILIAVAPALSDRASAERLGAMVTGLGRVETHLVLPAATPFEEARRSHDILASGARVHCLLPTGVDTARTIGGTLALALEEPLAIRWTTDLEVGGQPTPADAVRLARQVLP